MKKRLCLCLAVLLCAATVAGSADSASRQPAYAIARADNFFSVYGISLGDGGGGYLYIGFDVEAVEVAKILGVTTYDVQRLVNGAWTTVGSGLNGSCGTDTFSYAFSHNRGATSGGTYRVVVKFYCQKYSGGSKTNTVTSNSYTLP